MLEKLFSKYLKLKMLKFQCGNPDESEFCINTLNAITELGLPNLTSDFNENDVLVEYFPIFLENYEKKYGEGTFFVNTSTHYTEGEIIKILIIIDEGDGYTGVYEGVADNNCVANFVLSRETLELLTNRNACIGFVINRN